MYPFHDGSPGGLGGSAGVDEPVLNPRRGERPGPSSLPIIRHRWSASTSFVLATLRALHVDSSDAVTGSAMIEEGTSSPRSCAWVTRTRTRVKSLNRPTFMPGGPQIIRRETSNRQVPSSHLEHVVLRHGGQPRRDHLLLASIAGKRRLLGGCRVGDAGPRRIWLSAVSCSPRTA